MKPASAMSFALKKPGRSALACACTGTDFTVEAVIAANAAERRRSRLVNISALLLVWSVLALLPRFGAAPDLAWRWYAPSARLTMHISSPQARPDVRCWHIASFRRYAEFGCYRAIADIDPAAPIYK